METIELKAALQSDAEMRKVLTGLIPLATHENKGLATTTMAALDKAKTYYAGQTNNVFAKISIPRSYGDVTCILISGGNSVGSILTLNYRARLSSNTAVEAYYKVSGTTLEVLVKVSTGWLDGVIFKSIAGGIQYTIENLNALPDITDWIKV